MKTILFIDDVDVVRATVRLILPNAGYELLLADSVRAAEEIWREHREKIGLIITDNELPDGSGIDLAERLRREKSSVKVIVASGYAHRGLPPHFFQLGKPFDAKFLLASVKGAFEAKDS